jgi:hypothetical protein
MYKFIIFYIKNKQLVFWNLDQVYIGLINLLPSLWCMQNTKTIFLNFLVFKKNNEMHFFGFLFFTLIFFFVFFFYKNANMIFLRNLTIYYLKYKYVIIFLERRVFVVFLLFFYKKNRLFNTGKISYV